MSEEGQRLHLRARSSGKGVKERKDSTVILIMRRALGIRLSNPLLVSC